jgi:hypothetical protein
VERRAGCGEAESGAHFIAPRGGGQEARRLAAAEF